MALKTDPPHNKNYNQASEHREGWNILEIPPPMVDHTNGVDTLTS